MGTAHPGEDPKVMTEKSTTNQFSFATDDKSEARRRLHLRDITSELSDAGDDRAGADLRIARERRGEDLRTIAMSLRIRREQLEALEESRYDDLPGRAYAVGFVRSYAEYLGLDSAHIVERYKSELDNRFAVASGALNFPDAQEQVRLPRGTFLIVALIIGVGAYGAYLMTRSADKLMAERVPAASTVAEAQISNPSAPDERRGLSGDPASAATRAENDVTAAQLLGEGAPDADPASVYAVPLVVEADPAVAAPDQMAALTTPATTNDMSAPAAAETPAAVSGLPEIPQGAAFGVENTDARVLVRARKPDAWVRIEDAQGHVLIERTLQVGDTYAVPNAPGSILVARDASAFELIVDHTSLGLAGPPTLVLTGKPLDPAAILAAMPRPLPTPAEEAAALAPGAATTR